MRRFNIFSSRPELREGRPAGFRSPASRVDEAIGGSMLAGKLYELPPGESVCPYHYELGDEEWLIVLAGRPTVRHPGGEDGLEPGDVVCFPAGPTGAHKISNPGDEAARVLIVSTHRLPSVAVYPDSGKVGVFTDDERDDLLVRRSSAVDYWDGEE
jgi:uncharacterized cupin superfamily protein